jgi:hypothetical protein
VEILLRLLPLFDGNTIQGLKERQLVVNPAAFQKSNCNKDISLALKIKNYYGNL